ncbi:MAG: hypothetical protein AAGN35_05670 [Bacteroidota bacterium]
MNRLLYRLVWSLFFAVPFSAASAQSAPHQIVQERYIAVDFYSAVLSLPALREVEFPLEQPPSLDLFKTAYTKFNQHDYFPFLKKAGDYRRGMSMSDWHYYNLIADYSDQCFPTAPPNFRVLFRWFILRKSGLDVQLFHTAQDIYLHARSEDIQFGFFLIAHRGNTYVNLTARRENLKLQSVEAFLTTYHPDNASLPLVMDMHRLPTLPSPDTIERLITFRHRGHEYEIRVNLNRDHLQIMDDYPYYNQTAYFNIGLSREAERSLLPQLEALLEGKTAREKVEFLLSFTRTSFFYKDDRRRYGREKPMTPEQTLYHSYSDCEDRSALFFYLNRKLVGLPAIVLDFNNHVGTAVELPGITGDTFRYKNREYVYCEATGPSDDLQIGQMWEHVRNQPARILTEYHPE